MPMVRNRKRTCADPACVQGPSKLLPEQRSTVRDEILARLTASLIGAIRQSYSNGEFPTRSLIVARTFEAAARRDLDLECASNIVHFDPELNVFWRNGGGFD